MYRHDWISVAVEYIGFSSSIPHFLFFLFLTYFSSFLPFPQHHHHIYFCLYIVIFSFLLCLLSPFCCRHTFLFPASPSPSRLFFMFFASASCSSFPTLPSSHSYPSLIIRPLLIISFLILPTSPRQPDVVMWWWSRNKTEGIAWGGGSSWGKVWAGRIRWSPFPLCSFGNAHSCWLYKCTHQKGQLDRLIYTRVEAGQLMRGCNR